MYTRRKAAEGMIRSTASLPSTPPHPAPNDSLVLCSLPPCRCNIKGCGNILSNAYYRKYRICEEHAKSPGVTVDGACRATRPTRARVHARALLSLALALCSHSRSRFACLIARSRRPFLPKVLSLPRARDLRWKSSVVPRFSRGFQQAQAIQALEQGLHVESFHEEGSSVFESLADEVQGDSRGLAEAPEGS